MDSKQFVATLKIQVVAAAIDAVMSALTAPPGTNPSASDVELSEWFKRQNSTEQLRVRHVAKEAAEQATFNVLTLLDGVTAIEDFSRIGSRLELYYRNNERTVLLNDDSSEELHNLFTERAAPEFSIKGELEPYAVATAGELRSKLRIGDGLDIHHVPKKSSAQQMVADYDPASAPAIALPKGEHKRVSPSAWDDYLTEGESENG